MFIFSKFKVRFNFALCQSLDVFSRAIMLQPSKCHSKHVFHSDDFASDWGRFGCNDLWIHGLWRLCDFQVDLSSFHSWTAVVSASLGRFVWIRVTKAWSFVPSDEDGIGRFCLMISSCFRHWLECLHPALTWDFEEYSKPIALEKRLGWKTFHCTDKHPWLDVELENVPSDETRFSSRIKWSVRTSDDKCRHFFLGSVVRCQDAIISSCFLRTFRRLSKVGVWKINSFKAV